MAVIEDLTWKQINDAAGVEVCINTPEHGVIIQVGALLKSNPTTLTAVGVVEALYELRELAAAAQKTVNAGQQVGERLSAFPVAASGTVVDGYVTQVGSIVARIPLATNGIVGSSN